MIAVDKIIHILQYSGPQTFEDLRLQGYSGLKEDLDILVNNKSIFKIANYYTIKKFIQDTRIL